jgi:SAM-dependent methyltransferase
VFFRSYLAQTKNSNFRKSIRFWYPIFSERIYYSRLDPVYFYQDAWCAQKVFRATPESHVDIASNFKLVSILAQFTPITFVDINQPRLIIPNVQYKKGDIRGLPFKDNSLNSLSSLCVIEHIGLGRYGDEIDAFGSEKAGQELARVLAPQGRLYLSLPVDEENRLYHNAHRAFTADYVKNTLCQGLVLINEQYIYGDQWESTYDPAKGFGTGLFEFTKE